MSQTKVPNFGMPFRIDDFQVRPEPMPGLQPVKTQRRLEIAKQTSAVTNKPETKQTANDMDVLIRCRLPANKQVRQVSTLTSEPVSSTLNPEIIEDIVSNEHPTNTHHNTIDASNTIWTFTKYACGCLCGCTVCITSISVAMALCYEWLA